MATSRTATAARVFLIFALGYFLSYLARGINLPLLPLLSNELDLSPAQIGLLTSLYLFAFALCQLPLGVALDRFGPRAVQGWLLLLAALGALISSQASDFSTLVVGRLLLGVGTSGCLMAGLKAIFVWFPSDRLPVLNGAIYAIGGLGSVATGAPALMALSLMTWRTMFLLVAALIFIASLLVWWGVPERSTISAPTAPTAPPPPPLSLATAARGIGQILRARRFWQIAPLATISQGVYLAVQGLWAGPFLRDVEGLPIDQAGSLVTTIGWAMVVGAASTGWLARRLEMRGISLHATAGFGMALFVIAQVLIVTQAPLPAMLRWSLFGLAGTTGILTYASLSRAFAPELAGRVSTALNLLVFSGAFLVQYGIGVLLDRWPHGPGHYAPEAHRMAWWIAIGAQTLCLLWYIKRPAPGGANAATQGLPATAAFAAAAEPSSTPGSSLGASQNASGSRR